MKSVAYLSILFCLIFTLGCKAQDKPKGEEPVNRKPFAAGKFYTANPKDLQQHLQLLFTNSVQHTSENEILAMIVPHAGYVFSGTVAASGYHQIDTEKSYEHVFIIAPSHTTYFNGASIYCKGHYETPLGEVKIDIDFVNKLIDQHAVLSCAPEVHQQEHSIEVQLPFLQYCLKNEFNIVPIVVGNPSTRNCEKLAAALQPYFNCNNLFVISSDFSHYPSYENAIKADKNTAEAILTKNPEIFEQAIKENESEHIPGLATSACGQGPILTLLYLLQHQNNISAEIIQYQNSGDSPYGDKEKVVGYYAIIFSESNSSGNKSPAENIDGDEFYELNKDEKRQLLEIARNSIEYYLAAQNILDIEDDKLTNALKTPCGAFVTLHKDGNLRGCIGRFDAGLPLYKTVQYMAIAAATQDVRFVKVTREELSKLDIEISVLTPLRKIESLEEFELGKHGIYIRKGTATGTFLPQVADGKNWTKTEFVSYCAQEKAGIGRDGWKNAELYTYEALIFNETEIIKNKHK